MGALALLLASLPLLLAAPSSGQIFDDIAPDFNAQVGVELVGLREGARVVRGQTVDARVADARLLAEKGLGGRRRATPCG